MGKIIKYSLKALKAARKSLGDGEPERAASFRDSAQNFKKAQKSLAHAHPGELWQGTASTAYHARTSDQENRVATLAASDSEVASICDREGDQLLGVRNVVEYYQRLLHDVAKRTYALQFLGPEGKVLQASIETFYVGLAIDDCVPKIAQMHHAASANASQMRSLRDVYQQISSKVIISDSSNDFDPKGSQAAGGDLRVTADHIRALATHQDDAVRDIGYATMTVDDKVAKNLATTHGLICHVTASALSAAKDNRFVAGRRTQEASSDLSVKLKHAAARYDETDATEKAHIDGQIRPGR